MTFVSRLFLFHHPDMRNAAVMSETKMRDDLHTTR